MAGPPPPGPVAPNCIVTIVSPLLARPGSRGSLNHSNYFLLGGPRGARGPEEERFSEGKKESGPEEDNVSLVSAEQPWLHTDTTILDGAKHGNRRIQDESHY